MDNQQQSLLLQFVPLMFLSMFIAVQAHLLAKEKGRNVKLWTVLGVIPIVNFVCIGFFIGAANLRLEKKVDELLSRLPKQPGAF